MSLAIVLAGGTGSRIKSADIPKQYIEVGGKPIISYVLETVYSVEEITDIAVVAEPSWQDEIFSLAGGAAEEAGQEMEELTVNFAEPGENRQMSVLNGLKALSDVALKDDLVAVIDAARPNMSRELLAETLSAAAACDGAIPVLPMKDTVYLSKDGKVISSLLPREQVFAGQAPEAFRYGKYLAANEALLPDRILTIHGSTELAILAGLDIAVIPGDEENFKITTDADLQRFREQVEKKT